MKYQVKVTQEILDKNYDYYALDNCSIYHALKAAGLPVRFASIVSWYDMQSNEQVFPIEVRQNKVATFSGFSSPFEFEVDYEEKTENG